jgi:hypothetical protein
MAQQFLATRTWNPVEVMQDLRIPFAGMGVMAAYIARNAAYRGLRNIFGYAIRLPDGRVQYVATDGQGRPVRTVELPGAHFNRILFNLGSVVAGTLIIGQSGDGVFDYLGLGIAAGGIANIVLNLLHLE